MTANPTTPNAAATPAEHYYTSPAGNRYVYDRSRPTSIHWRSPERLRVTIAQTGEANWRERRPLVMLENGLGFGAEYSPDTLRAIAATLARIADDADAHPMGPRSYWRSDRGYDVLTDQPSAPTSKA